MGDTPDTEDVNDGHDSDDAGEYEDENGLNTAITGQDNQGLSLLGQMAVDGRVHEREQVQHQVQDAPRADAVAAAACHGCGKDCKTIGGLKAHLKSCHAITFTCNECNAQFQSQAALHGHRKVHATATRAAAERNCEANQGMPAEESAPTTRLSTAAQGRMFAELERRDAADEAAVAQQEEQDERDSELGLSSWESLWSDLALGEDMGLGKEHVEAFIAQHGELCQQLWGSVRVDLDKAGKGRGPGTE